MKAARYTGTWSTPAPIDAAESTIEAAYDLTSSADGRVVAVWVQAEDVYQAVFSPTQAWGSAFRLETASGGSNRPSVALGGARGMAIWDQDGGGVQNIQGNEYRSTTGWAGPQAVEPHGGTVTVARVVYDDARNTFLSIWLQAPTGYQSVYSSRYE